MTAALLKHRVYLELGPKKVFACSLDWPGWCRIDKTEELALDRLMDYVPRYRVIAERAGLTFDPGDPVVVERVKGTMTTDFGAPDAKPAVDDEPMDDAERSRTVALMRASWELFDECAADSPEELRKGPRGGGRDRDKMVAHVEEAERAYIRKIGVKFPPLHGDRAKLAEMREATVAAVLDPPDDTPWPMRFFTRRLIWHVIDHLWEMEDRRV